MGKELFWGEQTGTTSYFMWKLMMFYVLFDLLWGSEVVR